MVPVIGVDGRGHEGHLRCWLCSILMWMLITWVSSLSENLMLYACDLFTFLFVCHISNKVVVRF